MSTNAEKVFMLNEDIRRDYPDLGEHDYEIRNYSQGEFRLWAEITTAAGEFDSTDAALKKFENWTGNDEERLTQKCFFLLHKPSGDLVGTATAWSAEMDGKELGQLHWLSIIEKYQGRGLSRILVTKVLSTLAQDFNSAFLKTARDNFRAINLYSTMGFSPLIRSSIDRENWRAALAIPGIRLSPDVVDNL